MPTEHTVVPALAAGRRAGPHTPLPILFHPPPQPVQVQTEHIHSPTTEPIHWRCRINTLLILTPQAHRRIHGGMDTRLPLWATRVLTSDLGRSRPVEARELIERSLGRALTTLELDHARHLGEVAPTRAALPDAAA